jgi:acetyl-CoA acetyltransferase
MTIRITGVGWHLPDIVQLTRRDARAIPAMVYQAVRTCLDDASLSMSDIDAVVTASVDLWDGKTASNIAVTEAVGAVMKAETRIAGDGLLALMHGAMMVLSGHYQRVLVVAHGKSSEADVDAVSNWSFDPVYQQTLGLTDSQALSLQCQMIKIRAEEMAGAESIDALVRKVTSGDSGELQARQGDGACAVILEAGEAGIVLEGFGYDLDAHYLGDRDLARSDGLARAAAIACKMAGLANPQQEIARYYWSLRAALQLPLWAEAGGACTFSEALAALPDARHRIQWSGLPPFAAGLQRLIAAVRDMRENPESGRSMVHGCHGPAGQSQAVCLLKGSA